MLLKFRFTASCSRASEVTSGQDKPSWQMRNRAVVFELQMCPKQMPGNLGHTQTGLSTVDTSTAYVMSREGNVVDKDQGWESKAYIIYC